MLQSNKDKKSNSNKKSIVDRWNADKCGFKVEKSKKSKK